MNENILFPFSALEQNGSSDWQGDGGGPLPGQIRLSLHRPTLPSEEVVRRQLW